MNWLSNAQAREQEMIEDLQALIQIDSVLDESTATEAVPFGKGPLEALHWMLAKGEAAGMRTANLDNKVGFIEMGDGDEMVGILCHVDVVPAGSDWVHAPFGGEIEDGKLYGRGSIDDKGPTMAAWLAMKMVKDAGIQLDRRVRLIVGTDEETGFRCIEHYMANEEVPTLGFAPDAEFPMINAEKGIADTVYRLVDVTDHDEQLRSFRAGHRTNMVPDFATAVVKHVDASIEEAFQTFKAAQQLTGEITNIDTNMYTLTVKGVSAHAMEPNNGVNAAVKLATFLADIVTTTTSKRFVDFIAHSFGQETRGHALGLAYSDDMSGETTLNAGVIEYEAGRIGEVRISMRYPVSYDFDTMIEQGRQAIEGTGFELVIVEDSKPHYVAPETELVQKLSAVYTRNTGEEATLLSTGGGTYARELPNGVAFGMLFPGEPELAHQHDEYVVIENLVKAAAIYADAIVELATITK
jgi:succinyl-diaminopimelate desuccinylase